MMCSLYTPLDPEKREIRVLEICPDAAEDRPVKGFLRVVSLDDSPNFEALSYVWGDITELTNVTIDECTFGVSKNLADFLLRLRHPSQARVVWVDYVCINQLDTSEKNTQVPLMSDIYRCAASVVARLGERLNPYIEEAVAYNDATEGRHTLRSKYWLDLGHPSTLTKQESQAREYALVRVLEGSLELMEMSYWKRLWTFQEWHLPTNEPLCMCGKLSFQLGNLILNIESLELLSDSLESDFEDMLDKMVDVADMSERAEDTPMIFPPLLLKWHNLPPGKLGEASANLPLDVLRRGTFRGDNNDSRTLTTLLCLTSVRQCSHPLDRVYALYGMVPQAQQIFPPDYRKSVDQVLVETTAYMINWESPDTAFQAFDLCDTKSLPSWVLNFHITDSERSLYLEENRCVNSMPRETLFSGSSSYAPRISNDLSTLHLRGRPVGRAFNIHQLPSEPVDIVCGMQVLGSDSAYGEGVSGHPLLNAVYNCVKGDTPSTMRNFIELIESSRTKSRDELIAEVQKTDEDDSFCFSRMVGTWAFEIDSSVALHTVGITECDVQDGDHLIIPCGVRQVFIIRECPDTHEDGVMYHKIVGRAYVEGIGEDPEFQMTSLLEELEKRPFHEFFIC
ncbi:HET-domain-containing protein [Aspergillus sclerotiicarbonarius CBS 121057]|uniref:HET-domain-containing protein n=1 Tax=Aspergillus sclerotiicarbonarius (strain CBS 121057 / IBT 28362) TaxID=1448318 RepID=A0A319EPK6_ASPSB|nr:HET-domain-containing protein [Aspergillus sclerotiicarbonarius CBS 121057]